MRIVGINKTDRKSVEVSEQDLKDYLKYSYRSISEMAWAQFVNEGAVATPTTAYFDLDHARVKEVMNRKEGL